jgi:5-formyltetrahydrofolate cyclo-ligase
MSAVALDLDVQKAAARKLAFAARKLAFAAGQGQAGALLADYLAPYRGLALAGYMAMRTEADPIEAMRAHQGPVCVPVIVGAGQALRFRQWTPGCEMVVGEFGAQIPAEGAWIEPEVLIVPLVGFDARGYRLGYGGGFYDRSLEALRARRGAVAVGFGFAAQQLGEVPIDGYDQCLDAMVTVLGVLRFG